MKKCPDNARLAIDGTFLILLANSVLRDDAQYQECTVRWHEICGISYTVFPDAKFVLGFIPQRFPKG